MSFLEVKDNQASKKFFLCRMLPSRYLNPTLTSIGGGVYSATLETQSIIEIKENETVLTKVETVSSVGEWSFNELTKEIQIFPSDIDNAIVCSYYLFFTSERFRNISENPMDTNTAQRDWEPRISNSPSIAQSIKNVINGIVSISASSVEIINTDRFFQKYTTENDSFYQKKVDFWLCLDSVENIDRTFSGRIDSISVKKDSVLFSFDDSLSKLKNAAFLGDDASEVISSIGSNPLLDPAKNGQPIPFIFGSISKYSTLSESVLNLPEAQKLDNESLGDSICISFNQEMITTNNRSWAICRVSNLGVEDFSCYPIAVDNSEAEFTKLTLSSADKFFIGDTFKIGTEYARILLVDRVNNFIYTTKLTLASTSTQVESNSCPSLVIAGPETKFYPVYGRDYTSSVITTSGNNKKIQVTFIDNFEANHVGLDCLDPTIHFVGFRVHPVSMKHGECLKYLLEKGGLEINAASFASADLLLPVNVNFSIPTLFESGEPSAYLEYAQLILSSSFGYLTLNNYLELEYKLFQAPSSSLIISDTEILKDSFDTEIEYSDIVSEIIAYNPHCWSGEMPLNAKTLTNPKAYYLHGIDKIERFIHCLEDMSTRLADILAVKSERLASYNFKTKTINLDSRIGDDIKLSNSRLLGESSTKDCKIVSINKTSNSSTIKAIDLYNL